MASLYPSLSVIATSIVILFLSVLSRAQDNVRHHGGGIFSLDMIHRDAPLSPFYDSSLTNRQRASNALRRSRDRINRFISSKVESPDHVIYSQGEYLVNISFGTPPRPLIGVVDTGSNIIWTQCLPCTECFRQNPPLFDPSSSSTYRALSCTAKECRLLTDDVTCSSTNSSSCDYEVIYGDGSNSTGIMSLETVTLDSTSIPNTIFGCGHLNGGSYFSGIESAGIVGLGRGPGSFISQIAPSLVGGKYFSYCLGSNPAMLFMYDTTSSSSSKMYFGRLNTSSGPEVVTTPLFNSSSSRPFYYLELQGISIGAKNLTVEADDDDAEDHEPFKGNMIIDSWSAYTCLPESLYDNFESEIRKELAHLEVTKDPTDGTALCFLTRDEILPGPNITIHFNGADVKLKSVNNFLRMDDGTVCLAFLSSSSYGSYGTRAQIDFMVGYDLENKILSFQTTDCTPS